MISGYKKSDFVILTYVIGGKKFSSSGIVLDVSSTALTLGHNFKHTSPVDTTKILIKDILESKKVTPKEINSFDDLGI